MRILKILVLLHLFHLQQFAYSEEKPKEEKPKIDFERQILPVLTMHCRDCHNAEESESGFRVDTAALLLKGGDRGKAVIAGNSKESLLAKVLTGTKEISRMPLDLPALKPAEIELIANWIDQGANIPDALLKQKPVRRKSSHWSFQPLQNPELPEVQNPKWVRNPIDQFVLAKLQKQGLTPSPEANRNTLIRRLSLDLLGLLPSPEDVRQFVEDKRPDAYEHLVDRLLAAPHYGEKWARHWLDRARYADSNGFTIDGARSIWPYRDWVIKAINQNMPFDQFAIEQLAGDLLPEPTTEQLVATGFHRNTLINQEGGTDKEQFRVEAVVDRVNTTGAVFLGLTIGCAQCHQHKYDPISQREFYELYAFFNNGQDVNSISPTIALPTADQQKQLQKYNQEIAIAQKRLKYHDAEFSKGLPEWETALATLPGSDKPWAVLEPLEGQYKGEAGTQLARLADHSLLSDPVSPPLDTYVVACDVSAKKITALKLEALTYKNLPRKGPGLAGNGNFVLTQVEIEAAPLDAPEKLQPVKISHAVADHSQQGHPIASVLDGSDETGWAINVRSGNMNVNREAVFLFTEPIDNSAGSRITVKLYHQSKKNPNYKLGRFRLSATQAPAAALTVPEPIRKIAATPKEKRTADQQQLLANAYLEIDPARKPLLKELTSLKKKRDTLNKQIPTTMVMRDLKEPRETHIQIHGNFLNLGAKVEPNVPAVLPAMDMPAENRNRLALAKWLVSQDNPLTPRVTVNRYWQQFFGHGIVKTENDFGTQGERPTHPQLLDWLAHQFVTSGWNVKALHKLIVTSSTYRQSSRTSADLQQRDPANQWLARQSRIRLSAETIRDACLSASGLLENKIGGPGIYPPQPGGMRLLSQNAKAWPESKNNDRYRRGLYIYFWRSNPYPFLMTFDAPKANTTCTRRTRSNTPLQALTLANDKVFFEFAQGLAQRIMQTEPKYDADRIRQAYRVCLSREPNEVEHNLLTAFLLSQRKYFQTAQTDAKAVAPAEYPDDVTLTDAASWTALARVLLNLDEFITRE